MSRKCVSSRSRTRSSSAYASGIVSCSELPEPSAFERPRRADAGDDVLALRVRQELAVEPLLAGRRDRA